MVHNRYREKNIKTSDFIQLSRDVSDGEIKSFIEQWLTRDDLPKPQIQAEVKARNDQWEVNLQINQNGQPYHFLTSIRIDNKLESRFEMIEIKDASETFTFIVPEKPTRLIFNALNDIPLDQENFYTWFNFFDDYHQTIIVYGTKRQIEANHTLALRFSTVLADRYTESLPPVVKDSEIDNEKFEKHDLIILGGIADNRLMAEVAKMLPLDFDKNMYRWNSKTYAHSDQGLFTAFPNPFNPRRTVYLFNTNSAMHLYQMTKDRVRMPSWAIYEGDKILNKGYHENEKYIVEFE
jgi:hypothetical protein